MRSRRSRRRRGSRSAHVVSLGNEKGGSGKSITAMHVALMKAGQRVATIDLEKRQGSFSPYIDNRGAWPEGAGLQLEPAVHFRVSRRTRRSSSPASPMRSRRSSTATTSSSSTRRRRHLSHAARPLDGGTLITPLNDSFIDPDVLGTVDPETFALTATSHYSEMVREARRQRCIVDGRLTGWVVVRKAVRARVAQQAAGRRHPPACRPARLHDPVAVISDLGIQELGRADDRVGDARGLDQILQGDFRPRDRRKAFPGQVSTRVLGAAGSAPWPAPRRRATTFDPIDPVAPPPTIFIVSSEYEIVVT